jgi:hypothetical protein
MLFYHNRFLDYLSIIIGIIIVYFAIGYLLFRLLLACFGMFLINYGMSMQGQPSLHFKVYQWMSRDGFWRRPY